MNAITDILDTVISPRFWLLYEDLLAGSKASLFFVECVSISRYPRDLKDAIDLKRR
jgi:hypothetical protein